jgi:hypothetical protein
MSILVTPKPDRYFVEVFDALTEHDACTVADAGDDLAQAQRTAQQMADHAGCTAVLSERPGIYSYQDSIYGDTLWSYDDPVFVAEFDPH